jgi:hypothetical protein
MTSLTDTENRQRQRRRRREIKKKKNQEQGSSEDDTFMIKRDRHRHRHRHRDQSLKKRKPKNKSSKKEQQPKNEIEHDVKLPTLDQRTEHTSNLTEHSRSKCNFHDEEELEPEPCDGDITTTASISSEHTAITTTGNSVETRESRFQSLLNQWKTRESEQKEKAAATNNIDTKSKVSYLSEDEDHSCFEGVMKHWRKRDENENSNSNEKKAEPATATSTTAFTTTNTSSREATAVEIDDDPSEVSSLGDSLKWGCDSDSRFDFGFDARLDSQLQMSPPERIKKKVKPKKATGKKREKKDESSSVKSRKKKSESKSSKSLKPKKTKTKTKKAIATFEAAMNASMVSESSTIEASESTMEASESTTESSVVSSVTTESKRRKKKTSRSKSKSNTRKSKKPLDSTETTFHAEDSPLSEDEGSSSRSERAYLPIFLTPKKSATATPTSRKKKARASPLRRNGPLPPLASETIPFFTSLSDKSPRMRRRPSASAAAAVSPSVTEAMTTSYVSERGIPYFPNILAGPSAPIADRPTSTAKRRPTAVDPPGL